jgi:hypothetical protein
MLAPAVSLFQTFAAIIREKVTTDLFLLYLIKLLSIIAGE